MPPFPVPPAQRVKLIPKEPHMPPAAKVEAKCAPAAPVTAENWNRHICEHPKDTPFQIVQVPGIAGLWACTCHGIENAL